MWGDGGAYGTWSEYLERWQRDLQTAEGTLPVLRQEDFTVETWTRLVNRIFAALGGRLQQWSDALSSAMSQSATEFAVGRSLAQARAGLRGVLALADHPSLPEDQRTRLREAVERQVRSAQSQLEQQVDRLQQSGATRAQVEERRRTLRENPLDAVLSSGSVATAAPAGADPWAFDPTRRPRRTLAID